MRQLTFIVNEVEVSPVDPGIWRVRASGSDVDNRIQFIMYHRPPAVGSPIVVDIHI